MAQKKPGKNVKGDVDLINVERIFVKTPSSGALRKTRHFGNLLCKMAISMLEKQRISLAMPLVIMPELVEIRDFYSGVHIRIKMP